MPRTRPLPTPTFDPSLTRPTRRRPLARSVAPILALALAPVAVWAQAPEQGTWSVGLPLFTENVGSVLNIGFMTTDRLLLGLEVNLRAAEIEEEVNQAELGLNSSVEDRDFAFGPVVKWYGSGIGPVTPFLRLRGLYGRGSRQVTLEDEPFREIDTSIAAAALSIGAEWFPIRQLSLSGHTGFEYSRETLERVDFDGDTIDQERNDFGTFRSALAVTFYFR